uniref:Uncharacterized protein n=1 Tax=Candidatus Nitrotoga fabula TaxID=2182327 RepID=A0A2X0QRI8_9PROT|nr:conserved protein of unknown function [Candidatus Nitrotoga fabula]
MQSKSIPARSFWVIIIAGFVTGMGNGSVFGAALMCWMGRGGFEDWGGMMMDAYVPTTFNGFMTLWMLLFGLVFTLMLALGLKRHDTIENARHG